MMSWLNQVDNMDDSNENTQLLDEEGGSETEIFTADRNKKGEDFRG